MAIPKHVIAPALAALLGGFALGACGQVEAGGGGSGGAGGDDGSGGSDHSTGGCFAAGTLVATPRGSIPIERLREGDQVWAFDVTAGKLVARPVTAVMQHPQQRLGTLHLSDGRTLRVTSNHPFFLPEQGAYAPVGSIQPNTALVELRGEDAVPSARLLTFTVDEHVPLATVYNITVAEHENYFADGILVHNKTGGASCWRPDFEGACDSDACLDAPNAPGEGGAGGEGGTGGAPKSDGASTVQASLCASPGPDEALHIAFEALLHDNVVTVFSGTGCAGDHVGDVRGPGTAAGAAQWETYCFALPPGPARHFLALVGHERDRLRNLRLVDQRLVDQRLVDQCSCTADTQYLSCGGLGGFGCQAP